MRGVLTLVLAAFVCVGVCGQVGPQGYSPGRAVQLDDHLAVVKQAGRNERILLGGMLSLMGLTAGVVGTVLGDDLGSPELVYMMWGLGGVMAVGSVFVFTVPSYAEREVTRYEAMDRESEESRIERFTKGERTLQSLADRVQMSRLSGGIGIAAMRAVYLYFGNLLMGPLYLGLGIASAVVPSKVEREWAYYARSVR